jgi:hypothetical protein
MAEDSNRERLYGPYGRIVSCLPDGRPSDKWAKVVYKGLNIGYVPLTAPSLLVPEKKKKIAG